MNLVLNAITAGVRASREWFKAAPKCFGKIYDKKHLAKNCIRAKCEYYNACLKESGL